PFPEPTHDSPAPTLYPRPPTPQPLPQDRRSLRLPSQSVRPALPTVPRPTHPRPCPPLPPVSPARQKGFLALLQPGRLRPALLLSGTLSSGGRRPPPALRQATAAPARRPFARRGRPFPSRRYRTHSPHVAADHLRRRPTPPRGVAPDAAEHRQ